MRSAWQASSDRRGTWSWTTDEFSNGWAAQVVDDSQAQTPARPTDYKVQAVSRTAVVEAAAPFTSIDDAKRAAVYFALSQRPVARSWKGAAA
jgi:hypothetical protein